MKFKRIMGLLLATSLLLCTGASAKTIEFTIGSPQLYVRDESIESKTIDAPPYIENSRTMVPVRVVSENFGAEVLWDPDARKVTVKTEDTSVELTIDSSTALVNGEEKALDCPAIIKEGRTMVPLRFVSEALGKNVEYVDASKQILITDKAPAVTIDGYNVSLEDMDIALKYITYTPDDMTKSVLDAFDYFSQIVPVANAARENGFYLNDSQKKELTDSVMNDKDAYYSAILTAPLIKVLSDNLLARSYMDILLEQYPVSDEQLNSIYTGSYIRAKHILILTEDPQTGEALSKREKEKAKKQINDIAKKLKSGEDFDALMNEYCQDPGVKAQPDGYVFTYGEMVEEFETAAFDLKEGEISDVVESDFGYHIIKREPLPEIDEYTKLVIRNVLAQELTYEISQTLTKEADIKIITPVEDLVKIFS